MGYCRSFLSKCACGSVCVCAQKEIIASLGEGNKLFNRGANGGKAISSNVLFLLQQLYLTPVAPAGHYLSSHCFPLTSLHAFTLRDNSNKSLAHDCMIACY
ncbi:hypothetical protein AMECASPLE_004949 [Ameca splendens]|uniref:Uncharacterized protein n=1 Tax=Ameca splendens TaxID=208324 RepID=A0ABV0ZIT0_9TELE